MAVARIVGVVAVAALSALAAYFLYLKSKKENEGEKNVDKNLDVSESSNTYKSEIKSVIPGDATVDNDKNNGDNETNNGDNETNKGDNETCENEVEDFEKININLSDRPRRMSYRDALMAAVDNEDKKESETVVETSNQVEAGNGSCGQSTVQSEIDSANFDSMTSSVAFEFLSRPVSVEEKNPEKSEDSSGVQLELPGVQIPHSDVEEESLVQIISQSEPSPISMEESFVAVIPNDKKVENDSKTSEYKDVTSNDSALDSQPSIVILEQTAENVSLDDKIDFGSSDNKDDSVPETDRHPSIEILETSSVSLLANASTDANISNDKVSGEKVKGKEEVEIIDLACDDNDVEEDNERSSRIFVTEVETKRLTRGALKAMAEDVDDKEEITLLKESKLDTLQGDLDISDFSDDDDDSPVVSDNSEETEIIEVNEKKTDDVGKESLTSKDVDSKEKLEEKTSDDGANPSGDVSKSSDSSG